MSMMTEDEVREFVDKKVLEHTQEIIHYGALCRCLAFSTPPKKYRWERGDCPYDSSGYLEEDGVIDLDHVTLGELCEDYYTGISEATFTSGCGLSWTTYNENISHDFGDMAYYFAYEAFSELFADENFAREFCAANKIEFLKEESVLEAIMGKIDDTIATDIYFFAIDMENIPEFYNLKTLTVRNFMDISKDVRDLFANFSGFISPERYFEVLREQKEQQSCR